LLEQGVVRGEAIVDGGPWWVKESRTKVKIDVDSWVADGSAWLNQIGL
jgi:hypothetical protein